MEIKTSTGFTCKIEKENLDNMELIDALAEVDDGNFIALSKTCNLLLGKEQKRKLYNYHKLKDGRVPTEIITAEIIEIFNLLGEQAKN